MSSALTDEIFVAVDDLTIDTPVDPQLPAQQVFYNQNPANPDKRQAVGEFSWFATIAPRNDGWTSATGSPQVSYTLSIVVLQGRDNAMPLNNLSERWAIIPFTMQGAAITSNGFFGGGVSGGDVALVDKGMFYQIAGQAPPPPAPQDLVVKRGQWIMLARNSSIGPILKWYKITEADPDVTGGAMSSELLGTAPPAGFPIRHVSLFGQDWTFDAESEQPDVRVHPAGCRVGLRKNYSFGKFVAVVPVAGGDAAPVSSLFSSAGKESEDRNSRNRRGDSGFHTTETRRGFPRPDTHAQRSRSHVST